VRPNRVALARRIACTRATRLSRVPDGCAHARFRACAAEKSGFTLSKIESLGLLSKAESLGALSLATDRGTPGKLSGAGLLLLALAAGIVVLTPDTDTTLLVAQAVGAAVCGAAGVGALVGASILGNLQK
jgi:hypothetical protein